MDIIFTLTMQNHLFFAIILTSIFLNTKIILFHLSHWSIKIIILPETNIIIQSPIIRLILLAI
jgi:hypothetical protein